MVRVLTFTSGFDAVRLVALLVVLSPSLVRLPLAPVLCRSQCFILVFCSVYGVKLILIQKVAVCLQVLSGESDVFNCVIYAVEM